MQTVHRGQGYTVQSDLLGESPRLFKKNPCCRCLITTSFSSLRAERSASFTKLFLALRNLSPSQSPTIFSPGVAPCERHRNDLQRVGGVFVWCGGRSFFIFLPTVLFHKGMKKGRKARVPVWQASPLVIITESLCMVLLVKVLRAKG